MIAKVPPQGQLSSEGAVGYDSAPESESMASKTTCPISRADFLAKAQPVKIDINGFPMMAGPREFSTGSFGWYVNGKATITVDGKPITVQVGMNLTVVGSKDLPRGDGPAKASPPPKA